jgi:D-3-phosphoglycerate dehydrogenase
MIWAVRISTWIWSHGETRSLALFVRKAHRMSPSLLVGLLGPPFADSIYLPIAAQLEERGHRVMRYTDAEALRRDPIIAKMDVVLSIACPFNIDLMSSMPQLRAILSPVTGIDGIDEQAAASLGIPIGTGQTQENYISMAEAVIMLILACLYDLPGREAELRNSSGRKAVRETHMLWQKTVGLIGFGKIAQAIAERLTGWDVQVQATTSRAQAVMPFGVAWVSLEDLLRTSDVVVVAAALNAQTRNMLNAERLGLMKPSAVLVNAARGAILDESALATMIHEQRIAAVALDAFTVEPLPPDSPLRAVPNTILTPHAVGHTSELRVSLIKNAVDSVDRVSRGLAPNNVRGA